MGYYILGCIFLGTTTGFLVGASQSPVVQYVLPLLFALIGGSASIFALRTPAAGSSQQKLKIVGATTAALTLPFLITTIYGSLVRTGNEFSSLVPSWTKKAEDSVLYENAMRVLSASDAVSILIANRNLKLMLINEQDRKLTIQHAINTRIMAVSVFETVAPKLLNSVRDIRARFETAAKTDTDLMDDSGFFIHLIEFENLEISLANKSTALASKITAIHRTRERLEESITDVVRVLLLTERATADSYIEMITLIHDIPTESVPFEGVEDALKSAVNIDTNKTAASALLLNTGRGLASTD